MKALVIDCAASCMHIAAKNEDLTASVSMDLGQKQSQRLLPTIDYVLSQLSLNASQLDYTALTSGPGTFTGLRLAFSALKAIELANDTPIYGIPSLSAYAFPFESFEGLVLSVIDAKKDQFFAAIYEKGKCISEAEDTTAEVVEQKLDKSKKILLCGPDAELFSNELMKINPDLKLVLYKSQPVPTEALFSMAESMIEQKKEPLADYDGPVYLRKSEAEIKLESQQ